MKGLYLKDTQQIFPFLSYICIKPDLGIFSKNIVKNIWIIYLEGVQAALIWNFSKNYFWKRKQQNMSRNQVEMDVLAQNWSCYIML